jgi:putative endonuclease
LIAKGYTIVARNWRQKSYEIDIIARKGDCLAIVEVKSSRTTEFGPPELRVTKTKQKRLAIAAQEYISSCDKLPDEIRFDVIAITWPRDRGPEIEHLEGAFFAEID